MVTSRYILHTAWKTLLLYVYHSKPTTAATATITRSIGMDSDDCVASSCYWKPHSLPIVFRSSTYYETSDYRTAISSDGSTIVIGLPSYEDSRGAVWTYHWDDATLEWNMNDNIIVGDYSLSQTGYDLALNGNGNILIVGSPHASTSGPTFQYPSRTRVYRRNKASHGGWEQLGSTLMESSKADWLDEEFDTGEDTWYSMTGSGTAVAISYDGYRVAVGAPHSSPRPGKEDEQSHRQGQVNVYEYDESVQEWIMLGESLYGKIDNHVFGFSLDMSADGTMLIVGSPQVSYPVGEELSPGAAYAFELLPSSSFPVTLTRSAVDASYTWKPVGSPIEGDESGDLAGFSVAIDDVGTRIVIGYPDFGGLFNGGLVRVFDLENNGKNADWVQVGSDILPDDTTGYGEGRAVAISGDGTTIAVYSPKTSFNDHILGMTRIWRLSPSCRDDDNNQDEACDWAVVGDSLSGERGHGGPTHRGRTVGLTLDGNRLALASSLNYTKDYWAPHDNMEYWEGNSRVLDLTHITNSPTVSPSTFAPAAATASSSIPPSQRPVDRIPPSASPTLLRSKIPTIHGSPLPTSPGMLSLPTDPPNETTSESHSTSKEILIFNLCLFLPFLLLVSN